MSDKRAAELQADGHAMKKDGRGRWRRVVGSPRPLAQDEAEFRRRFEQRFSSARMAHDYVAIYNVLRDKSVARAGTQVVPLLARARAKPSHDASASA